MNTKLSVVVSAYNDEKRLAACLESVKGLADECIVVDNSSTDDTASVAKKHGARVFTRENYQMLNKNKNFGFSQARGEWILNLDSDEMLTPELKAEISSILGLRSSVSENKSKTEDRKSNIQNQRSNVNGYLIPRKNIIFGKWIQNSIWWPDYQLRLFRRGKGTFEEKHVHELLRVEGEVGKLNAPIQHDNYSSISQWIQKMDRIYTENEADNIVASGKKVYWVDAIRFPVEDFLKTFFLQKGYRDGLHGLVLSLLQAFYAEVVFIKVWERQGFPETNNSHFLTDVQREFRKIAAEFGYWFTTQHLEESSSAFKKMRLKLLRRFYKSRI